MPGKIFRKNSDSPLDIPREQIEDIRKLVIKHHPEAEFEGLEPILPPSY